ncbi:MAG: hypothetical protein WBQ17_10040 [Rhizomicrobium sp.]
MTKSLDKFPLCSHYDHGMLQSAELQPFPGEQPEAFGVTGEKERSAANESKKGQKPRNE